VQNIKRNSPQVLVATPGRLIDLIENYGLDISGAKFKILDEGDKMLDMGFQEELSLISSKMSNARGMIFSATVPLYI
jgi:superfamily II DNA/RNA helicase